MSANVAGARLRAEAARVVDAVVTRGRSLDAALVAAESTIAPGDRALLRMLCYGAVRFHWHLSAQVGAFLKTPLKSRDSEVHALLVLGIYQLTDTRISDHAAVSLTVEATRRGLMLASSGKRITRGTRVSSGWRLSRPCEKPPCS